jgi:hypothetical protein
MIHPHTERRVINPSVGVGVVATRPIPAGTIIWTLCEFDIILPRRRVAALSDAARQIAEVYGYVDNHGDTVLCWDDGRFVNHSCAPSMLSLGHAMEICVRELQPGDELTCEYGTLNYASDLECQCGRAECRGIIRAGDALLHDERIDALLDAAVANASHVDQPLLPYVQDQREWRDYLEGLRQIPGRDSYFFAGVSR